jgi:hypothetical protein
MADYYGSIGGSGGGISAGNIVAGEGIVATVAEDVLTISCEDATEENKGVTVYSGSTKAVAGTDTESAMTPADVKTAISAGFPSLPVTHSTTEAAISATLNGQMHLITGAYTITLPVMIVGQSATFVATTAAIFSLDSTSPDQFVLAGVSLTAGNKITSDGSAGATVTVYCTETNKIRVLWTNSTFIDGGA